jgi:hypothetical protein
VASHGSFLPLMIRSIGPIPDLVAAAGIPPPLKRGVCWLYPLVNNIHRAAGTFAFRALVTAVGARAGRVLVFGRQIIARAF